MLSAVRWWLSWGRQGRRQQSNQHTNVLQRLWAATSWHCWMSIEGMKDMLQYAGCWHCGGRGAHDASNAACDTRFCMADTVVCTKIDLYAELHVHFPDIFPRSQQRVLPAWTAIQTRNHALVL